MTELAPPKVETICLNCVFAEWDQHISEQEGHVGKTVRLQTGCALNLLQRFKDVGVTINEYVDDKSGDEFNSIEDRVCMYNRQRKWKNMMEHQDIPLPDIARQEIAINVALVVYVTENNSLEDLVTTIKSVGWSSMLPTYLIVVFDQTVFRPSTVRSLMDEHCLCEWRVEYTTRLNRESVVMNMCAKKTDATFLLFIRAGDILNRRVIEDLDVDINDELKQILISIKNQDDRFNHCIIHKSLIRLLAGRWGDGDMIEGIEELLKEEECQHMMQVK